MAERDLHDRLSRAELRAHRLEIDLDEMRDRRDLWRSLTGVAMGCALIILFLARLHWPTWTAVPTAFVCSALPTIAKIWEWRQRRKDLTPDPDR